MPAPAGRSAYYGYRLAGALARFVPSGVGAATAAAIVARVGPRLSPARARQVERNLARVHGAPLTGRAEREAVAATFASYGRYFFELFRLPVASSAWIRTHMEVLGFERLERAVEDGRGVILALPHLGNWDLAGAWLADRGIRPTVVVEPVEPPELFEWFVDVRSRLGMTVLPLSSRAAPALLRVLRAGGVVCLVSDRDLTGDGVEVPFFGEHTTLPGGPALLALRTGATILPVGCFFRSGGRQVARILDPIAVDVAAPRDAEVRRVTAALASSFEVLIRSAPQHWHLMQPNWPSDTAGVTVPKPVLQP